jgi:hypothetical protein
MKVRFFHFIWLLCIVVIGGAGCSSVGVRVQRDPAVMDVAIDVHVIGITDADKEAWTGTNVTAYWSQVMGGNINPKVTTLQFNPGQKGSLSMKTSPKGISDFVVISDYPSVPVGVYLGAKDPRLCIIPLDKLQHSLFGSRATVKIHQSGIQLVQ